MKYFGTDGIRGKVNEKLTSEIAYKVGRYLGYKLTNSSNDKFLIGKDTRLSGDLLEFALGSGLMDSGCNVELVGVVTTPMLSYLLEKNNYVGGIMISASHNPFYDNGLKIMDNNGFKIDRFLVEEIEAYLEDKITIPFATNETIGKVSYNQQLVEQYTHFLKENFKLDYSDFKISVDCANGSASNFSSVFKAFNIDADIINNQPNGININDNCGSTHIDVLQKYNTDKDFDLGISFDGDGDRLMLIDDKNNIVDGDKILYLLAKYYQKNNELVKDTLVVTVMSNIGLHQGLKKLAIKSVVSDVGDQNVLERMEKDNLLVGGEQSGHIILKKYSNMGDGFIVLFEILTILKTENKKLSELLKELEIYPQVLKNIKVVDAKKIMNNEKIIDKIDEVNDNFNGDGRLFVRPSGTEPLIRVMVEAKTEDICHNVADDMINLIKLHM